MKRQTFLDMLDQFMAKARGEWEIERLDTPTKNALYRLELSREVGDWKHLKASVQGMISLLNGQFKVEEFSEWEFHFVHASTEALYNWKEMFK